MSSMFDGASSFNQNISDWGTRLHPSVDMSNMLNNTGITSLNYDALLTGFSASSITNRRLGAAGLSYCSGIPNRNTLTSNRNWTILEM